ncbi:hypothetical protein NFI96_030105 [Prochilodus magdalenae]|nr:hypothetical protein NFI96_030105 [Prochilodus magdalenae]
MTVRFKGISEYQNKYKARPRRVKSASPPRRRMRLAGARSDQLGICREPQFQSKRRVPFYPAQVSTSLQWEESAVSQRPQNITRTGSPPAVFHASRASSAEKVETPLAPRVSKPLRTSKTIQPQEEVSSSPSADQQTQKRPSNGMLYTSNRSIPPFKSNPVEMETEYKRSFKGSPPPRPLRLRRDVELNEVSQFQRENVSPQKKGKRRKKREQHFNRKSGSKEGAPDPQSLQNEARTPYEEKDISPKVMRKVKTEYTSNFRSPLQYCYRDGVWVRSKTLGEEVCDLREKAEAYRRRAWGTHFSREHLSQILSEQNCLWEASSASSSSTLTEQDSQSHNSPIIEALDLARARAPEREPSSPSSPSVMSRCSLEEGRLPTPRMKTMLTGQRTHHDRTTPATGGAMLVSPPKTKNSSRTSRKSEAPLGKAHSSYRHFNHSSPPRAHSKSQVYVLFSSKPVIVPQAVNGSLPRSPPAAGMATVDLLPLREDTWAEDSHESFPVQKTARLPQKRENNTRFISNNSPRANRIQGTLRNSEFQHNGNLGLHRPDQFVFPSSDSGVSDDDDRLSQISSRSAASCSMASQVLDRAQRRKKDFWGKS